VVALKVVCRWQNSLELQTGVVIVNDDQRTLMYSTCRTIAHSQEAIVWMPVHVSMLCFARNSSD
jgi:hypothetical protein